MISVGTVLYVYACELSLGSTLISDKFIYCVFLFVYYIILFKMVVQLIYHYVASRYDRNISN